MGGAITKKAAVRGIPSAGKLLECKEEKMDAMEIRNLKLFFSRDLVQGHPQGVEICFREKGIKFNESGAVLTDLTTYNGLTVGDWCFMPPSYFLDRSYYTFSDAIDWGMNMKMPRIIFAFFEIEAQIITVKRPVKIRRVFCATGVIWVPGYQYPDKRWAPDSATIVFDGKTMKIDVLRNDGRDYVKLFPVDFLKKLEKEDLLKE